MSHEINRLLATKLLGIPHLIQDRGLDSLVSYAMSRKDLDIGPQSRVNRRGTESLIKDGVGYIPVTGALTYESSGLEALCGMSSYQGIQAMYDDIVAQGVKTVVLDTDTPGGEAYGAFEAGRELRNKADRDGVRLIAYVDGVAASAGYVLASAAHEVVANPYSEVGSIGVVVRLANSNRKDAEAGIDKSYVYAGASKVPFDADGNFTEEYLADLQEKVDILYKDFTTYVSEMRGIDEQVVMDTEAKTFRADKALELGLVDSLLTREEFLTKLTQSKEGGNQMPLHMKTDGDDKQMSKSEDNEQKLTTDELPAHTHTLPVADEAVEATEEAAVVEAADVDKTAELQAQLDALQAKFDAELAEKAELVEQARQVKLADLEATASNWEFAGVDAKAYAEAALDGVVPVSMFDAAMNKAKEELSKKEEASASLKNEFEAMGESGVATGEATAEKEDGTEKFLKQQGLIK